MSTPGDHYRRSRLRLTELLSDAGEEDWRRAVPTCPAWQVHDVVAHLVGIIEDAFAGRLDGSGPPGEDMTAEQVERHRADPGDRLLARWDELAPPFEQIVGDARIWRAAFDVVCHEHDVRTALGRPGARDDALITEAARLLVEELDVGATIVVDLGDRTLTSRPGPAGTYRLATSAFEVFRLRLGRRTRDQVMALDWSSAPGDWLDELFVFGPAAAPIHE
jgi:uncharacterized protein (TIGR03083 family)